jgi:uncharacterized protein (DUF305 family)
MIKGNEGKATSHAKVEDVDFISCDNSYHAWMNKEYNSNFQKPYPNSTGAYNNYSEGNNNGNRQSLEDSLKSFLQAQTEQNSFITKMSKKHEAAIGQLSKYVAVMKTDINELQERIEIVEAQLGKIAESQTLILAQLREN